MIAAGGTGGRRRCWTSPVVRRERCAEAKPRHRSRPAKRSRVARRPVLIQRAFLRTVLRRQRRRIDLPGSGRAFDNFAVSHDFDRLRGRLGGGLARINDASANVDRLHRLGETDRRRATLRRCAPRREHPRRIEPVAARSDPGRARRLYIATSKSRAYPEKTIGPARRGFPPGSEKRNLARRAMSWRRVSVTAARDT